MHGGDVRTLARTVRSVTTLAVASRYGLEIPFLARAYLGNRLNGFEGAVPRKAVTSASSRLGSQIPIAFCT